MIKKAIILVMIACSILAASTFSVKADDNITVSDDANDVVFNLSEKVPRPNIDIASVSSIKTGGAVEIKLTLIDTGIIQDNENIVYYIYLTTSANEYEIVFSNGECIIYDANGVELEGIQYSGVGTTTLTINFDLLNSDEDPEELMGMTMEIAGTDSYYSDNTETGEPTITVDIGELYEGKVGESISFTATIDNGTPPYELQWDFGDGETSDEQNPSHVYNEEGTYDILLMVTDNESNYGFDNATVIISASGSDNDNGKSDSSGSGLTIFIVLIAIIVIAGVAVVVYIIRR